jgi:hypothetical protein
MTFAGAAHGFWKDVNLDCFLRAVRLRHGSYANEGAVLTSLSGALTTALTGALSASFTFNLSPSRAFTLSN